MIPSKALFSALLQMKLLSAVMDLSSTIDSFCFLSFQYGHSFCCKFLLNYFLRNLTQFHCYNDHLCLDVFKIPGLAHNIHASSSSSPLDMSTGVLFSWNLTVLNVCLFSFGSKQLSLNMVPYLSTLLITQNHFRFLFLLFIDIRYTTQINEFFLCMLFYSSITSYLNSIITVQTPCFLLNFFKYLKSTTGPCTFRRHSCICIFFLLSQNTLLLLFCLPEFYLSLKAQSRTIVHYNYSSFLSCTNLKNLSHKIILNLFIMFCNLTYIAMKNFKIYIFPFQFSDPIQDLGLKSRLK